jgi:hypothetical protein
MIAGEAHKAADWVFAATQPHDGVTRHYGALEALQSHALGGESVGRHEIAADRYAHL